VCFERWLYTVRLRLRSLFRRRRVERELDDELAYHMEREIESSVQTGMDLDEARYRALRKMNGLEIRKEECRDMRRINVIDNLVRDLRYGLRNLRRNPGFTAAVLLTLALGVGVNVAVFAIVEAVLLRPLPYAESGRLVVLNHRDRQTGFTKQFIAIGDYVDILARESTFEAAGGYGNFHGTLFGEGDPLRIAGLSATPGALDALRVKPILGRGFRREDTEPGAAPVIILGYDLWQNHFGGDPHIVGRGVKIDQQERQIVGIAPKGFQFPPKATTELIIPLTVPRETPAERKGDWTFVVARLKGTYSLQDARANLATISHQLENEFPRSNEGSEYYPVPLRDFLVGNTKPALILLFAAVAVVLLIACLNVANLMLARSLARGPEMTLRMALGAGSRRLTAQLLTESFTLAAAAGVIGIVVAGWGAHGLVRLVPKSVSVSGLENVGINSVVLMFALLITIVTALGFGIVSALTLRNGNAAAVLGTARVTSDRAARGTTSLLVIAEIALAIVLMSGAGLILRSFDRLLSVDPGFRTEGVRTMDLTLPSERYKAIDAREAFYRRAFQELQRIRGVQEAGVAVVVPLTGNHWTTSLDRADRPKAAGEHPPEVGWQTASAGYFKALQIPLLAGRLFNSSDTSRSKPVVIISKAIQDRYFPGENPIGRELRLGNPNSEIIGVVGNIRRASLREEPHEDLYIPFEQRSDAQITLFVRTTAGIGPSDASLQSSLRSIEPDIVFDHTQTLDQVLNESVGETQLALWLLGIFAATGLTLSGVGVYGVVSYATRLRTREIGTRVAMGATRRDVVWLVMRQGAIISVIGIGIGLVAGQLALRSLMTMMYDVSTSDPVTLAIASGVLFISMMTACYLPARRASSIDPVRALTEQ
jgi:putative ABC transport system permease protein